MCISKASRNAFNLYRDVAGLIRLEIVVAYPPLVLGRVLYEPELYDLIVNIHPGLFVVISNQDIFLSAGVNQLWFSVYRPKAAATAVLILIPAVIHEANLDT